MVNFKRFLGAVIAGVAFVSGIAASARDLSYDWRKDRGARYESFHETINCTVRVGKRSLLSLRTFVYTYDFETPFSGDDYLAAIAAGRKHQRSKSVRYAVADQVYALFFESKYAFREQTQAQWFKDLRSINYVPSRESLNLFIDRQDASWDETAAIAESAPSELEKVLLEEFGSEVKEGFQLSRFIIGEVWTDDADPTVSKLNLYLSDFEANLSKVEYSKRAKLISKNGYRPLFRLSVDHARPENSKFEKISKSGKKVLLNVPLHCANVAPGEREASNR